MQLIVLLNRELQNRNRQAHHEWAKAHQQELQQLRVVVARSTETILCSARFQDLEQQLLTAVETATPAIESKSLSTNEPGLECQKLDFRHQNGSLVSPAQLRFTNVECMLVGTSRSRRTTSYRTILQSFEWLQVATLLGSRIYLEKDKHHHLIEIRWVTPFLM
jgi:hypothetical protein